MVRLKQSYLSYLLAGGAATEVFSGDDDGVTGLELVGVDEGDGVCGGGEAAEGEGAELAVLVGFGGDEGEMLGGDDSVGAG
ncbi:hypothetical protein MRB53_002647 [Persea americana]|uniref:Uncharacterized protein n=1 Tax=Persea americana TaxID=3435 RepID=A0ACC2MV98_PERAE|nr:hypothetical protein MRB53_002647 [Persea americana]